MKKTLLRCTALLLTLLVCMSTVSCMPLIKNVVDLIGDRSQGDGEFDYEGDLTPGGDKKIRRDYGESIWIGNDSFCFDYTEAEAAELMEQIDQLYEYLDGDDFAAFLAMFTYVQYGAYARMESQCCMAQIEYSLYRDDPEAAENYEWMRAFSMDVITRISKLYRLVYDSPGRDIFYDGWTPVEIENALFYADSTDEEYAALQAEYDALMVEYYALDQNDASFMKDSAELYVEAVRINNEIAQKMGFDDYMDFAYQCVYMREYTPDDVAALRTYAKEQLVPLFDKVEIAFNDLATDLRQVEQDKISTLFYQDMESEMLYSFAKGIGGTYFAEFDQLLEEQNYFVAYDPNASRNGAFTDYLADSAQPIMYFGAYYQDHFTMAHEYGHYYSFAYNGVREVSYDLCELQSQGNEWLYLAYISEQNCDVASKYLTLSRLYDDLCTVFICLCVDEFEQTVYANPDLYDTPEKLDALYREICDGYLGTLRMQGLFGYDPAEYWHYVALDAAGYYVSYAISLFPCFELYYLAETDYDAAVQTYLSLTEYSGSQTFSETLARAGLQNPLDEGYTAIDFDKLYKLLGQRQ